MITFDEITSRKSAELALQRSQYRLKRITDNIPVLISYIDPQFRYRFNNAAYKDWFDIDPEQLLGSPVNELVGEKAFAIIKPRLQKAFNGEHIHFEEWINYKPGIHRYISAEYIPDKDELGNVKGLFALVVDLTDRRQSEEEIENLNQQIEKQLREIKALLDAAPIGIFFGHDPECKNITMNKAAMQLLRIKEPLNPSKTGPNSEQMTWRVFQDGRELSGKDLPMQWSARHGKPLVGVEQLVEFDNGDLINLIAYSAPVKDDKGEIIGAVGTFADISHVKQTEQQQRIAAVAFESRDAMMVTDAAGIILKVNKAFTHITGYSADEAVGKSPAILRSGRHDDAFYRKLWGAVTREGHWEGQIWNRRKDGGIFPEWLSITSVFNDNQEVTHYVAEFADISDQKKAENKFIELAFYDPLTNLPNRRLIMDRIQQAILVGSRDKHFNALLLVDLDHFKNINDSRGHDTGDLLLVEIADRLQHTLREKDTAGRLGGDEFVVLLENLGEDIDEAANYAEKVAQKIQATTEIPVVIGEEKHRISTSIGITLCGHEKTTVEELLKQSDLALYKAKDDGRNTIRFYDPVIQKNIDHRMTINEGLIQAIANHEFILHYQPQLDAEGKLIGAESLIRWQKPGSDELISPGNFIDIAESSGLINEIGRYVLNDACKTLALWSDSSRHSELVLSVNVSARQFEGNDFINDVISAINRHGAPATRLKIEITESLLMSNVEKVINTMRHLTDEGIRFSIDDFGIGYSSLGYLKKLPLAELKIDQSFIRDICDDLDDRAIVQAIISLGEDLNLSVIAEGVETQQQVQTLKELRCFMYQGYLFSRPLPINEFESFLKDQGD